jgi:carbamoyltransferase
MRRILGISAFYHDSAAALVRNGEIIAAAQEERFSRRKNDESFPLRAIEYCLREEGCAVGDLDAVVFYEKPILKFTRALETFVGIAPRGFRSWVQALPGWLGEKLNMRKTIRAELNLPEKVRVLFAGHHQSHAASAFYPSPFEDAAILTVDGVGEFATTMIAAGSGHEIRPLKELDFPHSVGLLYSAFTVYCGFRVNSGEYKLMGLAPYGEPQFESVIREKLIDLKEDGSFRLNLEYFDFLRGHRMTNEKFDALFGGPPREPEGGFDQRHFDVAASAQKVTEEIILRLARHAQEVTGQKRLCMAGGVALNCVANGKILQEGIFEDIWVQPAAGDAGGALGAALAVWHREAGISPRRAPRDAEEKGASDRLPLRSSASSAVKIRDPQGADSMKGALLGPSFSEKEIQRTLEGYGASYVRLEDEDLISKTAALLAEGKVVGWVQGRMEFGPRALGNRSILGDPRSAEMQRILNLKVKKRESFRPFAPAVLRERLSEYFDLEVDSPYMLLVAPVKEKWRLRSESRGAGREGRSKTGLDRINELRSKIPAVTHVDYSARIQTVGRENERFAALLREFERLTGCPMLVNTSFNIRGEPVVCTPEDAYRCFLQTDMDYLAIGNFLMKRGEQPGHRFETKVELD